MPLLTTTSKKLNTPQLDTYQFERQKILKSYFEDIHSLLTADINYLTTTQIDKKTVKQLQSLLNQSRAYVNEHSSYLDFAQYLQLLASLQITSLAGFGIATGTMKSVKNFGIYGYALLSSADYQQFTAVADRIFHAIYEPLTISHTGVADELHIRYTATSELPANSYIPLMEQVVFCGIALMQARLPTDLDGVNWSACRIECNYPKPVYWEKYHQNFLGEVKFDMPAMQLCVPLSWLTLAFEAGDSFIFTQCQTQIESILSNFSDILSREKDIKNPANVAKYTQQVREILLNASFTPSPTIETVAKQMRTAERTLRYRLTQEQTSFRRILNEVRFELAKRYLCKSDFSIQEIAFLLGYQHIQNFYRAFIKDAKMPPEKFRQQHRGEKYN